MDFLIKNNINPKVLANIIVDYLKPKYFAFEVEPEKKDETDKTSEIPGDKTPKTLVTDVTTATTLKHEKELQL